MGASRFRYERELVRQGICRIAGADEVGRGPLAGPVVAAAAILPVAWITDGLPRALRGLNDSKLLDQFERERYYAVLTTHPEVEYAVASVDVQVIDSINIFQASLRAINEALAQLLPAPEHTLVDGPHVTSLRHPQTAIVDGDAKSYSIGAASVIAKVTRDRLMVQYDVRFPGYGFAEHKGYATPKHLAALATHGPCDLHRRSFAPIRLADPELFPPEP